MNTFGKIFEVYDKDRIDDLCNVVENLCALKVKRMFFRGGKNEGKVVGGYPVGKLNPKEWRLGVLRRAIKKQLSGTNFTIRGEEYRISTETWFEWDGRAGLNELGINFTIVNLTKKAAGLGAYSTKTHFCNTEAVAKYSIIRRVSIFNSILDVKTILKAAKAIIRLNLYHQWERDNREMLSREQNELAEKEKIMAAERIVAEKQRLIQERFNAALEENRRTSG